MISQRTRDLVLPVIEREIARFQEAYDATADPDDIAAAARSGIKAVIEQLTADAALIRNGGATPTHPAVVTPWYHFGEGIR